MKNKFSSRKRFLNEEDFLNFVNQPDCPKSYLQTSMPPQIQLNSTIKSVVTVVKPKTVPNPETIPIFVETALNNFVFRQLIRKSLSIQVAKNNDLSNYRLYFLLGNSEHHDAKLDKEINEYDDIIVGNFPDTYENLPYKTLLGYDYLAKYFSKHQWAIFHDDDAFMNYIRFYRISKSINGSDIERLYCFANEDWETTTDSFKTERPLPRIPGRDGKWGFSMDILPFGYIYIGLHR